MWLQKSDDRYNTRYETSKKGVLDAVECMSWTEMHKCHTECENQNSSYTKYIITESKVYRDMLEKGRRESKRKNGEHLTKTNY